MVVIQEASVLVVSTIHPLMNIEPTNLKTQTTLRLVISLGSKNGKFRMNTALFYTLIDDIQAYNTFELISFEGGYTNVGNAVSRGIEVELTFIPLKGLRLEQNFGYADASYKDFTIYDYGVEDYVNFKDKKVLYTPNITNLSAAQYTLPFKINQSDYGVMFRIEYRHVGEVYYSFDNTFSSPAYSLVNTSIGIQSKFVDLTFWTTKRW